MADLAQVEVNEVMFAEVPDQFVDYMVMNQIQVDPDALDEDEEHEIYLNNYMSPNKAGNSLSVRGNTSY